MAKPYVNDDAINQANAGMRAQPWYQAWFRSKGLDSNHVKLNDQQREELANLARANGIPIPKDMKIDPAGNLNEKGGWAGLPTGVKIAIIAGATLATAGAAGAFSGAAAPGAIASGGSSAAAGSSAAIPTIASTSLTSGMAAAAPSIAGTSALAGTTAATGGSLFSQLTNAARNPLVRDAAGRMLSRAGQASADNRGAQVAIQLDHDRMGLERDQVQLQAERDARSRQSDAYRKTMFGQLASSYQPNTRPDGVPSRITGGVAPTEEAREAGRLLYAQGMEQLKQGVVPGVNPRLTPYDDLPTRAGLFEQLSNYAGPALSLADYFTRGR